MADAAEEIGFLGDRSVRLKWPNDLVIEADGHVKKLAGVLGETEGLGGDDPRAIVGIGINADWPASEFPPELAPTMTSLREASGGRPIDLALLLDAFTSRLEVRVAALRAGRFDVADWIDRQLTNGRLVRIEHHSGRAEVVRALRADPVGGGLVVDDPGSPAGERTVYSGDVVHVRLDGSV
jgi:BirA family biotin operon repressor/biotin-[acetyl-CoA-carboxylase] ligase